MIDCLKCINSACCSLEVELDRKEYEHLKKLGYEEKLETRTNQFINNYPKYKGKEIFFDNVYKDNFAIIKKDFDGQCIFLNRISMKCTIYKNRPKVCQDYKNTSCEKIRELNNNKK